MIKLLAPDLLTSISFNYRSFNYILLAVFIEERKYLCIHTLFTSRNILELFTSRNILDLHRSHFIASVL